MAVMRQAKYPGRCGECGDPFEVGSFIWLESGAPPLCGFCQMQNENPGDRPPQVSSARYDRFGHMGPGYYDRHNRFISYTRP